MFRTLTEEERVLWTARLTKAETTYDLLMNGKLAEEFIDQNGEKVRYTKANAAGLQTYINSIHALLNPALAAAQVKRPLRFVF